MADPAADQPEEIGQDYQDAVLPGAQWEQRRFVRCDFTDADLRRRPRAHRALTGPGP
ncbi:hypothetical protein FHX69_5352 [Prauserella muralis]|nr:hypothetical protein FHX69_5352 [Prauserella muralis]